MLPTLSRLSVSYCPAGRLRHRSSIGSLRIPPLHPIFYLPLQYSSLAVSAADPGLSPGLSPQTYKTTYAPFTPSDSGQRSHPPYYRGCWHGVSRCFLTRYRHVGKIRHSSRATEVYTPKSFIPHAASLRQPLGHCARFPTAASRRSLGRISVPMWLAILSDQLPVVALVGRYPHQLADRPRAPLCTAEAFHLQGMSLKDRMRNYPAVRPAMPHTEVGCSRVTHPFAGCPCGPP